MRLALYRGSLLARASLCGLVAACALQCADGKLTAQVVQLPSVQNFSYSGAVSVPDQGDAYLGGNRSMRSGSRISGIGPLANRAISGQSGTGSVSVSATIIDLQAMDDAILNQPAGSSASLNYAPRATGTPVINTLVPHLYAQRSGRELAYTHDPNAWQIAMGAPGTSETGIASSIVRDDSEVRYYMLKAREATSVGRNAAARVYYRLAYEKLTPEQRARLQELQRQANEDAKAAKAAASGTADAGASTRGAVLGGNAAGAATASSSAAAGPATTGPATTGDAAMPADQGSASPF